MGKRQKHFYVVLTSLAFVALSTGYVCYALLRPLPLIQPVVSLPTIPPAKTTAQISWPAYGGHAVGAIGYGVLAKGGSEAAIPTASIAKVMTALCVLRKNPLKLSEQGPNLTLSQADVDIYNRYVTQDGSVVPVTAGEQLTEYQALQALLLPSANNIADTLANWAFGSIDAYTSYANDYAKSLGLATIHITDPSGLASDTVGSAADLTLLGEIAAQNPVIAAIASQSTATIPVAGTITNVNRVLGKNGIIGLKTGNNDLDPGAFLFTAKQSIDGIPVTITGTVMGAPTLGTALLDALPLIDSVKSNLHAATPIHAGEIVATYSVPWQGSINSIAKQDLHYLAWSNERLSLSNTLEPINGQKLHMSGAVYLRNGKGVIVARTDVKLSTAVRSPSRTWRLTHPL